MKQSDYVSYGVQQFDRFKNHLRDRAHRTIEPHETLLEFGCGRGEFLLAANNEKLDAYGVDISKERYKDFKLAYFDKHEIVSRYTLYNGKYLPYKDCFFDYIYSFYVLEHVEDLSTSLIEIVRVLKKGGIVALYAQDARTGYEGHAKIPYPPFLPSGFTRQYLNEWGEIASDVIELVETECFYITAPMIISILEYYGMEILYCEPSKTAKKPYLEAMNIRSMEDIQNVVRNYKKLLDEDKWEMAMPDIRIFARKLG